MENISAVVIAVGATARITRLIGRDSITQPLRDKVLFTRTQRAATQAGEALPAPDRPRAAKARAVLHELITCPWCLGLWVSAGVVALAATVGDHPAYAWPAIALTVSYATGLLASLETGRRPD